MKKLLVLSLVVVLTLSLAAIASAATFDPYVGGRITWAYMSVSDKTSADLFGATSNAPVTLNNSGLKMLLKGKISDEETGTWATIGAHINNWDATTKATLNNNIRDFGINNIGGSNVSVWYTNWENENMKRGQDRIRDIGVAKYHRDPMFDHAVADALGIDYNSDTVKVNIGYVLNKKDKVDTVLTKTEKAEIAAVADPATKAAMIAHLGDDAYNFTYDDNGVWGNETIAAATFKFDGGDVHVGLWNGTSDVNKVTFATSETAVGANMTLGFGSLAVDYVSKSLGDDSFGKAAKDQISYGGKKYSGGSQIQAKVSFTDLKLDVTLLSDSKYTFGTKGGTGYELRYGINDKFYVGYGALKASDKGDAKAGNMTDMYVGYKYGVLDFRAGSGSKGEGKGVKDNGVTYISCYASLW